ncbi:sigma-70 family RNA polymerase sigma factor [candidate division KSB1 bacterium]|nr:sigma-70 family RNA polymerase sigma factor [candidate division KSB1 bacterium]TDI84142.1 MAG: sigma-70 family RNA polymerase sigma factor [Caldithrix sp.]
MLKVKFFPEQQFVNRIKSNDRGVLGELFVAHRKQVFSYVLANGGREADAEDMLQEAIIVLWQNVCSGEFELRSKLSTYLLAVAKNKWLAERRKRSKIADTELPVEKSDGKPSALQQVIADEDTAMVRRALDALKPVCRELLMLFYFEERSFKDIARIMGFAGETVAKSKKYQCKKALESALQKVLTGAERRI